MFNGSFSFRCSPFSFSCLDGTCIPLESVCNSVRNCLDFRDSSESSADENEILCEVNRKCETDLHQCNLGQGNGGGVKCISKDKLCDGIRDCEQGGSDESSVICNAESSPQGSRSSRHVLPMDNENNNKFQHCPPLHESDVYMYAIKIWKCYKY